MASNSLGQLTLDLIANTGGFIAPLDAAERATQKALGRMGSEVDAYGNKVDDTYKKIGLSTKQLDNSFDRIAENMRREIALYKDSSRAAVLKYDLENGALRALSDSQKTYLAGLTRDLAVLDTTAGGAGGSMRSFRGVMQSAGYQAQDVAVQIQSGTSAFQIFSQQGSQFASAFGPTGAVVGALIAVAGIVGGVLFKSFMDTQKAVKDLEENVKSLAKEYSNLSASQKAAVQAGSAQVVQDLVKEYDKADTALQKQKKAYDELVKSQTLDLTLKNYGISALVLAAAVTDTLTFGVGHLTEESKKLYSVEQDQKDARKDLTAATVAHALALRNMQEAQDVTGASKAIREMTEENSLYGLRGKALYEATAALKGYDKANTKAFVSVMLLRDANKDAEDVKGRIKSLEDETIALELKNAEIHKNIGLQGQLAKKLADAKNTRPDGTRISTPEDQKAIAAKGLYNTKLKEKNDLDTKSIALYEQQDKAAKDKIRNMERENDLFGINSKAQQLEYDIKSGLIKINGGLESQQAKRLLQLAAELDLKEKNAVLDKSRESTVFAGYDNTKGDLKSTQMQYELDTGILKVNKDLTKEYYDQLIADQKIVESKTAVKGIDDYLKNQKWEIEKAGLLTNAEKLQYDIAHGIKFAETGITDEKRQQAVENQKILDAQAKQKELTDSIKDSLTSAIVGSAMRGEDAFKTLAKSVKGIFSALVLKPSLDVLTDNLAKSISSVLGTVGTKGADGKMVNAAGVLGAAGPYAAVALAVGTSLVSSWNAKQDAKFEKMTSEYRQSNQAIGTILGAANQKSDSLGSSVASLAGTAASTLDVNHGMYQALLDIKTGIAGTAAGFARTINTSSLTSGVKTGTELGGVSSGLTSLYNKTGLGQVTGALGDLGAFVDGVFNKAVSLISSKKTSIIDSGVQLVGTNLADILERGTIDAFTYADVKTTKKFLGITTSAKVKEATEALGTEFEKQFASVFVNAGGALEEASKSFGVNFDPTKFSVDASKLSLKGLEGDALTKAIQGFFSVTLDKWAGVLVGGTDVLTKFQKVGEGAFETVIRLASQTNTFAKYADTLGLKFEATGISVITATQNIADLSGGFDTLSTNLANYYQNFFTDAERAATGLSQIGDVLKTVGIETVPKTREAFRALVEDPSIDLATEAGQKYFSTLMGVSGAFAQLVPVTKEAADAVRSLADITNERLGLENRLLQLQGDTAELRKRELAALDPSNRAIQEQIYGLEDLKTATDAATAVMDQRLGLEGQLLQLTGDVTTLRLRETNALDESNRSLQRQIYDLQDLRTAIDEATSSANEYLAKLGKSIDAEKARITSIVDSSRTAKSVLDDAISREKDTLSKAHDDRLKTVQDAAKKEQDLAQATADSNYQAQKEAAKALQSAIQDQIKSISESVSGLSKLFDDINSSINDMALVTDEVTRSRRRAAEFEIETAVSNARAGRGVPTDGRINEALSTLKNNPASLYASLEEMTYATSVVQNKLKDLAGLTQDQMTNEQQTLALLQAQLTSAQVSADGIQKVSVTISDSAQAQIDAENENYAKQVATLDAMAEEARKQFDALSGIDTSVLSLNDAQKAFSTALMAADFVNAQEQLAKLDELSKTAKDQLDAALGVKSGLDSVAIALREFAASLVELGRVAPVTRVTTSASSSVTANSAELTTSMADMRSELTDINQETRKNTQDTADILRQMYVEGIAV